MPLSLALATGLGWLLAASPPKPSKPSNERSFTPCAPDTAEWTQAREALAALDARVEALAPGGDARDVQAALRALLDGHCFALSREESRWPKEKGVPALALKTWWRDGGKAWLASYLELGGPGPHTVVLPPDVRDVLTRERAPEHRLAALLCPEADAACGGETEAWRERAERAFLPENSRHRELERNESAWRPDCVAEAAKRPRRWRYTEWRSCLGDSRPKRKVLPLSRFRAPEDGWLVIRGRRGHYDFCDEVRAYHLGTGAAYVSASCSGLALTEGGGVDVASTDAARRGAVKAGRMAPERLRELTWMLLLGPETRKDVQAEAWRVPVPDGYRVERRERIGDDGEVWGFVMGGSVWGSTAQTLLRWSWFPPGGAEPLNGELTYPDSADVAQDHADVLLAEAERTFQEGCPQVPPPPGVLDFTRSPGVNGLDAPSGVAKVQDARVEALLTWRPPPGCGPGADGG